MSTIMNFEKHFLIMFCQALFKLHTGTSRKAKLIGLLKSATYVVQYVLDDILGCWKPNFRNVN